jgi:DNA helicase II / ATP-dependent DNA helicase PcrA
MIDLKELNPRQREAVKAVDGPFLVLAGAGTGKTRVITYRVAYLIDCGVPPHAILAVTFTNKAAGVMKERIAGLLRASGRDSSDVWISTFHSFCARLLRREADAVGLPLDFAIYDEEDQTSAVKRALATLGFAADDYPPRNVRAQISHAKNHGFTPDQMPSKASETGLAARADIATIFRAYEQVLRDAGAIDFDDLLLKAVDLLREHENVRARWNRRFEYILVDEFQDTNASQEELVRLLAGPRRNVCVVGDEDQSIYGWRGARAGNLKRFAGDFPDAHLIRLEQNYRSTQTILNAAAAVVENNTNRLGKNLEAIHGPGDKIRFQEFQDATAEARSIGEEIASLVRRDADARVAVLYRTTAQSRLFEEILRGMSVRHRVVGGMSFYGRSEVKTILAYIRLLLHPEDNIALLRVLNVPPRGIGPTTIAALETRAKQQNVSLWEALSSVESASRNRAGGALNKFRALIEGMRGDLLNRSPEQLTEGVLDRTGFLDWIEQQDNLEHTSRAENLRELANAMAEASERGETVQAVLDYAALVSDADDFVEDISVSLLTLHSAKGLEFDAVFLAGLEEGLLPHSRSSESPEELEEERRLLYVGMTRAKKNLTLSRAIYRRMYGEDRLRASLPSRFLKEIPRELLESAPGTFADPGEARRYERDPDFYESSEYSQRSGPRMRGVRPSRRWPSTTEHPASNPLIGTRVRHPRYGMGTITGVEGEGDERRLTVSFQDYGPKKLVERYANLQPA